MGANVLNKMHIACPETVGYSIDRPLLLFLGCWALYQQQMPLSFVNGETRDDCFSLSYKCS